MIKTSIDTDRKLNIQWQVVYTRKGNWTKEPKTDNKARKRVQSKEEKRASTVECTKARGLDNDQEQSRTN